VPSRTVFRADDANLLRIDFDALGECAKVVATIAAAFCPHPLAGLPGERFESLRCDARPEPVDRVLGPLCVGADLIADCLELRNSVLQHWVCEIRDAILNRVVEPLEFGGSFGSPLAQFGDVRCSAFGALFSAIEHGRQNLLEPGRLQEGDKQTGRDRTR
jgi:hypothetical protein